MVDHRKFVGRLLNTRGVAWSSGKMMSSLLQDAIMISVGYEKEIFMEMANECVFDGSISITAERLSALYSLSKRLRAPDPEQLKSIIANLERGAALSGVGDKAWLLDAINALKSVVQSSITVEDEFTE